MITSKDIIEVMLKSERIGRKSLGIDETRDRLDLAVTGIADKNVLTSHIDDTLQSVTDLIVTRDSTYCVITAFNELQGIITYRDIIALLGEKIEEDIPIFITGLPDDPLDAETAKSKFTNVIKLLRKIYPDVEAGSLSHKNKGCVGRQKEVRD